MNNAPTVTPTATASPTPTLPPSAPTPVRDPPEPTFPTGGPLDFDLTGIGGTFAAERVIAGEIEATFGVHQEARGQIERILREVEGRKPHLSSCEIGEFMPRFIEGQRYLLFFSAEADQRFLAGIFPLDGDSVVINDAQLLVHNWGYLAMQPATYERFFAGVAIEEPNEHQVRVTDTRVPLPLLLSAVEALRAGTSITPPDTGSAGDAVRLLA